MQKTQILGAIIGVSGEGDWSVGPGIYGVCVEVVVGSCLNLRKQKSLGVCNSTTSSFVFWFSLWGDQWGDAGQDDRTMGMPFLGRSLGLFERRISELWNDLTRLLGSISTRILQQVFAVGVIVRGQTFAYFVPIFEKSHVSP